MQQELGAYLVYCILISIIFSWTLNYLQSTAYFRRIGIIFLIHCVMCMLMRNVNNGARIFCLFFLISYINYKLNKTNFYMSMMYAALSYIVIAISDTISGVVLIKLGGFSLEQIKTSYLLQGLAHLIIALISAAIMYFIKFTNAKTIVFKETKKTNYIGIVYIVITLAMIVVHTLIYSIIPLSVYSSLIIVDIIIFIGTFVVNILVIYISNKYSTQRIAFEQKNSEYLQLKTYTEIIENFSNKMREFKHDYNNVIYSLGGYLSNGDIEGLRCYYEQIANEEIKLVGNQTHALQKIKDVGLKALIAYKVVQAEHKGVNVTVEAIDDISMIDMDTLDSCKIVGILFDNAIDAAQGSKEKIIKFAAIDTEECTVFCIQNTLLSTPNLNLIFKDGYSTKGEGRGQGLSIVRNIIDKKYDNLLLNTFIEDNLFIQELNIMKLKD